MKQLAVITTLLAALAVQAEPPAGSVRVGGGLAVRNWKYDDVAVSGLLLPQLRVDADGWFLPWLGVELELATEFAGRAPNLDVDASSLRSTSGRAGLAVRHHFENGLSLRAGLGWGGVSLPVVLSRDALVPSAITASGLSTRVEVGFETGRFQTALSGALLAPLAGSHRVFTVEPRLWVAVRMFDVAASHWWLGLDGAALVETGGTYSGVTGRVGLALRVTLDGFKAPAAALSAPPLPLDATLELRVKETDGTPVIAARVWVDDVLAGLTNDAGQLRLTVPAGDHALRVQRDGLRQKRQPLSLRDGEVKTLELSLETPTGPGNVVGSLFDSVTLRPIANGFVSADARRVRSAADGTFRLEKVGPGPVRVHVEVPGYAQLEEVAQVPPEDDARLNVSLEPVGRGTPAVIRGLVRARNGEALAATVRVQGQTAPVALTPEGRFELSLPPGSYTLTVTAPGFVPQARRFDVAAGEQAVFHCELLKP